MVNAVTDADELVFAISERKARLRILRSDHSHSKSGERGQQWAYIASLISLVLLGRILTRGRSCRS